MRLFQNGGISRDYARRLRALTATCSSFDEHLNAFIHDRYGACHTLLPALERQSDAFFTNGDDSSLQKKWARERGLAENVSLESILLAQIEEHRTEVFYNLDPMLYGSLFVRKLPGSVKASIAWRAAPSVTMDLGAYSAVVCNFPTLLDGYKKNGLNAVYFSPAHDPEMDRYATNERRPIDVLFVGSYGRHHKRRAAVLHAVASLRHKYDIRFCIARTRLTQLAESVVGRLLWMRKHQRPRDIRAISSAPVFGRALYELLSTAKIVLNGAVDMAGNDRGNMRCFEAMGCRTLLLSDSGSYPHGMADRITMVTYDDAENVTYQIEKLLLEPARLQEISQRGHQLVKEQYSKHRQWDAFCSIVGTLA